MIEVAVDFATLAWVLSSSAGIVWWVRGLVARIEALESVVAERNEE